MTDCSRLDLDLNPDLDPDALSPPGINANELRALGAV
jgi:hypothetical protein